MTGFVRARSSLSVAERLIVAGELDAFLASLTDEQRAALPYRWSFWRRPAQTPPDGVWRVWLVRAGRGFGKTRTGAETVRWRAERGLSRRIGLIAPTAADARDVMVEGESGLLAVHPPSTRPVYEPSKRRVTWPNGSVATLYSADEPERLRGPQHDWIWGDEPASWRFGQAAFDNAAFGLRLGGDPRMILTGTPKPAVWLRRLAERATTVTTTGSTYENISHLADEFVADIVDLYEGTRLGRQEIHAEWVDDVEGALWTDAILDATRLASFDPSAPWKHLNAHLAALRNPPSSFASAATVPIVGDRRPWRTIVAVDPPGETAECGIIVAAAPVNAETGRDHAVVLADYSRRGRPEEWAEQVATAVATWRAERVVVESNQGGDMVRATLHAVNPTLRVEKITATDSKQARAEPVSTLYARGWVHHVGFLPGVESQMVSWVPGDGRSPDRIDALVHAIRALLSPTRLRATVTSPALRRR